MDHTTFLSDRQFEAMRLLAEVAVPEIIAENRVPIRQTLEAGHQAERVAGQVVLVHFPHDLLVLVEFDLLVAVTAADPQMGVG